MKIQCDVCQKEEASVFCSADEAALCDGCDRRVHHANKLASKHSRYSLLHPTFKESPLCDICQERRALLFCQEHRAILCRECDLPIHRSNEHTQKHNRFLLTGVKLSASSSSPSTASSGFTSAINAAALKTSSSSGQSQSSSVRKHSAISNHDHNQSHNRSNIENTRFVHPTFERSCGGGDEENNQMMSEVGSIPAGSISEYLMETLPGWRVDEFLFDPNCNNNSSSSNNGYCKTSNNMVLATDYDFGPDTSSSSSDFPTPWTPVPEYLPPENPLCPQSQAGIYFNNGQESTIAAPRNAGKSSRKRKDGGLYHPQFSHGIHSFVL